jgi:hypothetical protein
MEKSNTFFASAFFSCTKKEARDSLRYLVFVLLLVSMLYFFGR